MRDGFAFTAKYWGDAAVVCRAGEDRPGPVVDQEFGQFQTWTQAREFAAKLNEGLEIPPIEAEQIITGSLLRASNLLNELDSVKCAAGLPGMPVTARPIRVQFMIAELELAETFCRVANFKSSQHADRMLGNARKAFFDAMHYLRHFDLAACDVELIVSRLEKVQRAFEDYSHLLAGSGQAIVGSGSDSLDN